MQCPNQAALLMLAELKAAREVADARGSTRKRLMHDGVGDSLGMRVCFPRCSGMFCPMWLAVGEPDNGGMFCMSGGGQEQHTQLIFKGTV